MADRSLVVRLRAEIGRFRADMRAAAMSVLSVADGAERARARGTAAMAGLSKSVRANRDEWDQLSSGMLVAGGGIAAGLGLATREAIQWESAWAGVTKTIDGTPAQYAELEGQLRGLAKTLPATHEEIAGVAEAAGQLGVAREDIAGFTETAIALGESTNLTAEEAASGLAKISNVMGTSAREGVEGYERLGSTLVALGNDGASTEADIVSMAQRISGAAVTVGASETDVLALSNALSSVGIEAELGGGAISRAMLEMDSAVKGGGDSLDAFARTAGVSSSQFAAAWRDDPVAALNMFVSGLGRTVQAGGDASTILDSVGLSGTQNAQVLLRAAGASDMLTDSLSLGKSAWKDNSALAEEASKRYATTESRLKIAQNSMRDAAIDLGSVAGPALASVAEKAAGLANAFVQLPEPVQNATTAIAGLASGALLLGGATVKVIGWSQDISDALGKIDERGRRADGSLGRVSRAGRGLARYGTYAVGIYATSQAIGDIVNASLPAPASIEATTAAILDLQDAGKGGSESLDQLFRDLDGEGLWNDILMDTSVAVDDMQEAYSRLADPGALKSFKDWKDGLFGITSEAEQLEGTFAQIGEALAKMPADEAQASFEAMVESLGGGEEVRNNLLEWMPAYKNSLKDAENQARMTGDSAQGMGADMDAAGQDAQSLAEKVDDAADAISGLGDKLLGVRGSSREYKASLQELSAAFAENGANLNDYTEAGRANNDALDQLAESSQEWAAAEAKNGASVQEVQSILNQGRDQWLRYAQAMGMSSGEANKLADQLFAMPDDVTTTLSVSGADPVLSAVQGVVGAMEGLDGKAANAKVSASGTDDARIEVLNLDKQIKGLDGKTIKVSEAGAAPSIERVVRLDGAVFGLNGKTVKVQEIGSTPSGDRVVRFQGKIYALRGKKVTVLEEGADASRGRVGNLGDAIRAVNDKNVNVRAQTHGLWDVANLGAQIGGLRDKTVTVRAVAIGGAAIGAMGFADGGLWSRYADGGMHDPRRRYDGTVGAAQPQIRPAGGRGILWAEDGAGPWEGFVSGHPAKRGRSRAVASDIVSRLGGSVDWGQVTEMASGGVYSNYRRQLSRLLRLSNARRYRWEDGSRMIQVFEDGTGRWRGWRAAPAEVTRALARASAARSAYDNATREDRMRAARGSSGSRSSGGGQSWGQSSYARSEVSQARWDQLKAWGWKGRAGDNQERLYRPSRAATRTVQPWRHSQQYYDDLAALRARQRAGTSGRWASLSTLERRLDAARDDGDWGEVRRYKAAVATRQKAYRSRYTTPKWTRAASGKWQASSGGAFQRTLTAAEVEGAMKRAVSGLKPSVTIGGREFAGVMKATNVERKGR